jgi:hypothetical protein
MAMLAMMAMERRVWRLQATTTANESFILH